MKELVTSREAKVRCFAMANRNTFYCILQDTNSLFAMPVWSLRIQSEMQVVVPSGPRFHALDYSMLVLSWHWTLPGSISGSFDDTRLDTKVGPIILHTPWLLQGCHGG
jgi:hypothetical protein